ncbi:exocyst complex component 2 [Geosmithia morbida]|uniref:Exocyst complex component SEC5 n=1 Tax=Geosmithia morbida TaxID=1094350 RepID=A0A9P5D4U2_9HYPO|nr:exocyst complex component 2 [Geosmithia morbida]KAF4126467.1 exocyst complex component 2 [Geosmithia morbida]
MADQERAILDFYQLSTPFPSEWPKDKDDSQSSGDEAETSRKKASSTKLQRRKSQYQALERATSTQRRSSYVRGSEGGKGGLGNLVQKDEPDPMGSTDSVVQSLKAMGLPHDDIRLRNRFLLSSTSFSPALFLSQVHATADTQTLLSGLDFLSQSIDQKSASLKVLVESNFERFVKAKATIDNVYKEMKFRGVEPAPTRHSRHLSRASYRNSSAGVPSLQNPLTSPMGDSRKKNALIKESEYGVMGIKAPLLDVSAKAEDVWGPALGGRETEETLKALSSQLDRFREFVELPAAIADSIKRKDYETLVEEYNRARKFADATRTMAARLQGKAAADEEVYQMLLAGRMWHDVEQQVQNFKRDIWKKLISLHSLPKSEATTGRVQDQHMDLINLLLELGVSDNPIWVWLLSHYDYLKSKIQTTADRSKVEIEVLRRRLANGEKPTSYAIATHLRSLGRQPTEDRPIASDSAEVLELWEKMLAFLSNMLSSSGILGEVLDFWQTVESFIDGTAQATLPMGYNGESSVHHQLSDKVIEDLKKGSVQLVETLRDHIYAFFVGPPPEDISMLFSPLPTSPSPTTPVSGALSPTVRDPRFNLDANSLPSPAPKRGETWEKLAFWPPWANSLSGVYYLSKMLVFVGSGASDMGSIGPVAEGDIQVTERLKSLVGASRERCVTALCAAWNRDAENIKYVEDWQRSAELGDVTRMPSSFSAFEGTMLLGMQKILYMPDAMGKPGAVNIVLPPPAKLLQMVRSQYVTTLYKALSGMVENAERSLKKPDDEWSTESEWSTAAPVTETLLSKSTLDAGDRNIRMLLTLSNLQALRAEVVPNLNLQFENAFSVKLTDESKTIRDVLGQIDARLFQSYTKKSIEKLRETIQTGLTAADWVPPPRQRPTSAKAYVYEALLSLVLVHSQVSTTSPSLTSQVLSFLLEQTSSQLLDAFRKRPHYPLEALMQATLDVEFVAQTLSQYTTDRASELQSQIYQELDSRTDNDARARLQNELPEMRSVLKKLRDASKNEFACFKKLKRPPGQGPSRTDSGLSTAS